MVFLFAILTGIIIGSLRKGTISNIKSTPLSLLPLGLIGIVVQIALHFSVYFPSANSLDMVIPVLNLVSYVFILVMLTFNLDEVWNVMMVVGTMANFVVTFMNAAKMPVAADIIASIDQTRLGQAVIAQNNLSGGLIEHLSIFTQIDLQTTKLWFLGINIKIPFMEYLSPHYGAVPGITIGTILVLIGIIGWVQSAMTHKEEVTTVEENEIEAVAEQPAIEQSPIILNTETTKAIDNLKELDTEPELQILPVSEKEDVKIVADEKSDTVPYIKVVPQKEDQGEKPQGFFTQNFYAEKEKSMHKEAAVQPPKEEVQETKTAASAESLDTEVKVAEQTHKERKATTDTDILGPSILEVLNKETIRTEESFFNESKPTETEKEEEALPVRKQKPIIVTTGGSNRGRSRKMSQPKKKIGLNEDDMRNVWQSVAKENQRLKQRGRGYVIEEQPKKSEEKRFYTKPVGTEKADQKQEQDLINQKIDETAFSVTKPLSFGDETPINTDDALREKAGYEKVHVTIEGKEISYWKKV